MTRSTPDTFYQRLGQRIRTARIASGYSQDALAECIGYGSQHAAISLIEAGKQRPAVHMLVAIADVLGTNVQSLLEEQQPHATS